MLRINLEESALAVVEEAILIALQRGAHSRGEALEMVCAEALLEWRYEKEIQEVTGGVTNDPAIDAGAEEMPPGSVCPPAE